MRTSKRFKNVVLFASRRGIRPLYLKQNLQKLPSSKLKPVVLNLRSRFINPVSNTGFLVGRRVLRFSFFSHKVRRKIVKGNPLHFHYWRPRRRTFRVLRSNSLFGTRFELSANFGEGRRLFQSSERTKSLLLNKVFRVYKRVKTFILDPTPPVLPKQFSKFRFRIAGILARLPVLRVKRRPRFWKKFHFLPNYSKPKYNSYDIVNLNGRLFSSFSPNLLSIRSIFTLPFAFSTLRVAEVYRAGGSVFRLRRPVFSVLSRLRCFKIYLVQRSFLFVTGRPVALSSFLDRFYSWKFFSLRLCRALTRRGTFSRVSLFSRVRLKHKVALALRLNTNVRKLKRNWTIRFLKLRKQLKTSFFASLFRGRRRAKYLPKLVKLRVLLVFIRFFSSIQFKGPFFSLKKLVLLRFINLFSLLRFNFVRMLPYPKRVKLGRYMFYKLFRRIVYIFVYRNRKHSRSVRRLKTSFLTVLVQNLRHFSIPNKLVYDDLFVPTSFLELYLLNRVHFNHYFLPSLENSYVSVGPFGSKVGLRRTPLFAFASRNAKQSALRRVGSSRTRLFLLSSNKLLPSFSIFFNSFTRLSSQLSVQKFKS